MVPTSTLFGSLGYCLGFIFTGKNLCDMWANGSIGCDAEDSAGSHSTETKMQE